LQIKNNFDVKTKIMTVILIYGLSVPPALRRLV